VRRTRLSHTLLFLTSLTDKDLSVCTRRDVDAFVAAGHHVNRAAASKADFLKSVKFLWRHLFPEPDQQGRADSSIVPYPVRHLSARVDKSRQRLRNERLTLQDVARIVAYFGADAQMQAYVALAIESLARPQELCYVRMGDVELHESYARIWIRSHGKEGAKFLCCIDSYPYLLRWYERHPFKSDRDAFLFLARGQRSRQLTPVNINKKLRRACMQLALQKDVTAYSLKRNGVTLCRLRGDSDVEIQHRAGWTSTKQLRTYDLSTPEDSFRQQLAKRGLIPSEPGQADFPATRVCACGTVVGFADAICSSCRRILDATQIRAQAQAEQEIKEVLVLALQHPELTFAELLERWRSRPGSAARRLQG
jgi:integrase